MFTLLIILIHMLVGSVAIFTGFAATFMPKGGYGHKWLGRIFFASILLLGFSGAGIAFVRDIPLSMLNGLLISYLVLTSFRVITQPAKTTSNLDWVYLAFGGLIVVGFAYYIKAAMQSPTGELAGFGPAAFIVFGIITLFALLEDIFYLKRGGAKGKYRIIRHLWRMYMPLFMSTAAFFLGQAKLFPEQMQASGVLFAPIILIIVTWAFWICRIKFGGQISVSR